MKDSRTVLLLFVSLCLVGTWIYHIYDKNNYLSNPPVVLVKDTVAIQQAINDSLRSIYSKQLLQIDSNNRKDDSLTTTLSNKLSENDSLRNEITAILNINNITREDLKKAEEKIIQLQKKQEQNRLAVNKSQTTVTDSRQNNQSTVQESNNQIQNKTSGAFTFSLANISLKAIKPGAGGVELTTNKANETDHFSITYSLVCNDGSLNETEVFIVLTDPAGNVIQDDQWQAGLFSTKNNIRIPYTRKNDFGYSKGEVKRFTTVLKIPEFNSGLYNLQVYHNGARIGKADLRLN
jgi:hypothetical protein